jgi:hypothetical protein
VGFHVKALLRWTIPPYTTIGKGPAWTDSTIEINCIPPRLNMWYRVVCIGEDHVWFKDWWMVASWCHE